MAVYHYNAQGQRTRKELPGKKPQVIVYHYGLSGQLLAETTDKGKVLKATVWLDNRPLAQLNGKVHGNNTQLAYLHTDHLDTPRLGIDNKGNIVWRWDSDAFGNDLGSTLITQDANEDEDEEHEDHDGRHKGHGNHHDHEDHDEDAGHHDQHHHQGQKALQVNLRFPGQYFDLETGLHYNWHRYYLPETGRYITSDPLGLLGGLNPYNYVSANPLKNIDPTGLLENFNFDMNNQSESSLDCECGESYPAFSGAPGARNDPSQADKPNFGPIPPGTYYIVDRKSGGRLGWLYDFISGAGDWFALYRNDGVIDDKTQIGDVTRGEFRLHPGSRSEGCVTLKSKQDFHKLRDLLFNTERAKIPGTDIDYYGTILVR